MRDPIAEFMNYNRPFAQRNPELLRLKVDRMAKSPFTFFRGTFHLFARDLLDKVCDPVPHPAAAQEMALVGDIHSENFGTYRADDGLVHYDINDFDETTRGRFDFDVYRLATSFFLASREHGENLQDTICLVLTALQTYTDTLRHLLKKGNHPELDVREGQPSKSEAVDHLLAEAVARKRSAFIEKQTEYAHGHRGIVRSQTYFNLPEEEEKQARRLVDDYRRRRPEPPAKDYFDIEDVCGRISGIGSMGRFRYAVLIAGKGSKEARNVILEFKESRPSAYDVYRERETDPAALLGRAHEVLTMLRASQAASNSQVGVATDGPLSFQVRELGPSDSRIDFSTLKKTAVGGVASTQAMILARTHARAAKRVVGVANPLAEQSDADQFCQRVLAFALGYADVVQHDWAAFVGRRAELEDTERWVKGG